MGLGHSSRSLVKPHDSRLLAKSSDRKHLQTEYLLPPRLSLSINFLYHSPYDGLNDLPSLWPKHPNLLRSANIYNSPAWVYNPVLYLSRCVALAGQTIVTNV